MMETKIIEDRLQQYRISSSQEEWNALREIAQEIGLAALSRAGFFRQAAFQGGTCLRILYNLPRFSEDLDFLLTSKDKNFKWAPFLRHMTEEFSAYGLNVSVQDRAEVDSAVRQAFVKQTSFGKMLTLTYLRGKSDEPKVKIKLEVDTNPPRGSTFETKFLDFPYPFSVYVQDLPSLFASKCHALLCRPYLKGRDWFDFAWYVGRKTPVNLEHLLHALQQAGPYKASVRSICREWLCDALREKIQATDFSVAKSDVERFLRPTEARRLEVWSAEFFMSQLEKMAY